MVFKEMAASVNVWLQSILEHPFNLELAAGTLSQQKFLGYLQQDSLYLRDFSRALACVSARLPTIFSHRILGLALGAVEAEHQLHETYLRAHDVKQLVDKNPACFAYTHYILSMAALGPVEASLASLVPCFWIYKVVGQHVAKNRISPNPFDPWISAYSSLQFEQAVDDVIDMMDVLAVSASEQVRQEMLDAFQCATRLEWLFWEDAYRETPSLSLRTYS